MDASPQCESFRMNDIRFLQEQHKKAVDALQKIESERDDARLVIREYEEQYRRLQTDFERYELEISKDEQDTRSMKAQMQQLDENIRLTAERNRQLKDAIALEELAYKTASQEEDVLLVEERRLERVAVEFATLRKMSDDQIMDAENERSRVGEELNQTLSEKEQLKGGMQNLRMHAKSEISTLEESLRGEKRRNTELLLQLRHNEIAEKKFQTEIASLKARQVDEHKELTKLNAILEGSSTEQEFLMKQKMELQRKLDSRQAQNQKTQELIEETNEQVKKLREAFNESGKNLREAGTNVYNLTDQLRMLQLQRKKRLEENTDKRKRLEFLEKQVQTANSKLNLEQDAHQVAVAEQRKFEQLRALLRKKNKSLEEALLLAQKALDKVERDYSESKDKSNALQTQNAYLSTRIEAIEEDMGTLKSDLKKTENQMVTSTQQRKETEGKVSVQADSLAAIESDIAKVQADLDYTKREDLLDDTGRVKPLLIESDSDQSGLVEKLQINEFLIRAQKDPKEAVSMLIEKIAQLLELIHTSQTHADQYLQDLNRSNTFVSQLRDKNKLVTDDVNALEDFKNEALIKFMSNSLLLMKERGGGRPNLYLANLSYGTSEVEELLVLLKQNVSVVPQVERISLRGNLLSDESLVVIKELLMTASYLRELDLRENFFSAKGLHNLSEGLKVMDGITSITMDEKKLYANSGVQLRLLVLIEGQKPKIEVKEEATIAEVSLASDAFISNVVGGIPSGIHPGISRTVVVSDVASQFKNRT